MQTYLIVSVNQQFIDNEIEKIKKKLDLSYTNINTLVPANSIGIDEVRSIRKIISRKPFGGGERLIIVNGMEKATVEAANALLKILEEPPQDTYIVLISNNLDCLLPTVVSRCQIISEQKLPQKSSEKEIEKTHQLIKKILTASYGERLLISADLAKSREDALVLMDDFLLAFDALLRTFPAKKVGLSAKDTASLIRKTLAAKSYINQNVNYKAVLDILFLGFFKTKNFENSPF